MYITVRTLAFCLTVSLTGVHFRGKLQYVSHVGGQKIKCRPIRTREIGGARLQEELYDGFEIQLILLPRVYKIDIHTMHILNTETSR